MFGIVVVWMFEGCVVFELLVEMGLFVVFSVNFMGCVVVIFVLDVEKMFGESVVVYFDDGFSCDGIVLIIVDVIFFVCCDVEDVIVVVWILCDGVVSCE